jgi:hypothetical protein
MNDKELAAVKQALEALMVFRYAPPAQRPLVLKAITALQSIISQDALDWMAENARELGLDYEPAQQEPVAWVEYETGNHTKRPQNCGTGYCSCIECVMEPAAQPAPVQEPVALGQEREAFESWHDSFFVNKGHAAHHRFHDRDGYCIDEIQNQWKGWKERAKRATPPAPQPVPVKTYHDGKPWPVAPKPWVGLTDDDIHEQGWNLSADRDYEAWTGREFLVVNGVDDFARAIEAKLKEKNHV